jgi:hypothetical protein
MPPGGLIDVKARPYDSHFRPRATPSAVQWKNYMIKVCKALYQFAPPQVVRAVGDLFASGMNLDDLPPETIANLWALLETTVVQASERKQISYDDIMWIADNVAALQDKPGQLQFHRPTTFLRDAQRAGGNSVAAVRSMLPPQLPSFNTIRLFVVGDSSLNFRKSGSGSSD